MLDQRWLWSLNPFRSTASGLCFAVAALAIGGCESRTSVSPLMNGADESFAYHLIDDSPNGGLECCTDILSLGDIDGDGYADVVVGAENAEGISLSWYSYPTWTEHPIGAGQFTTDGKVADMDGDGDMDVVVSELKAGLRWYENSMRFGGAWISHRISGEYAHDVEVGDLDGDGDLDVVTTSKSGAHAWVNLGEQGWAGVMVSSQQGEGLALFDIDRDGDLDIFYSNVWLETPGTPLSGPWVAHRYAGDYVPQTKVRLADIDGDGRPDAVLSAAEGEGRVTWFAAPADPRQVPWSSHLVTEGSLVGAHSLAVFDADLDGDMDVLVAEMHTSPQKRVMLLLQEAGTWRPVVLAHSGSHNMQVTDIDGDGDIDIVGKNYGGRDRRLELWESRAADLTRRPRAVDAVAPGSAWTYHAVDEDRGESERYKTGLALSDIDGDGVPDIIAGGAVYYARSADIASPWRKVVIDSGVDLFGALSSDAGRSTALFGVRGPQLLRYQVGIGGTVEPHAEEVAEVGPGRVQGYLAADLSADGMPDLVFGKGPALHVILSQREHGEVSLLRLVEPLEEAGLAVGDIDGDGSPDLVTVDASGHRVLWFAATSGSDGRGVHVAGNSLRWIDRVGTADFNQDGRLDIVFTEETQDFDYNSRVIWLEAPEDPRRGQWKPHVVATLRSVNSMSVADMNGDGSPDLVVAEHTDMGGAKLSDNLTLVFYNDGSGASWREELVESGPHSSHIGAQVADLDGDGQLEIVSIGWEQSCCIHMWRRSVQR